MGSKPSYIELSAEARAELEQLSTTSGWRLLRHEEIPTAFPPSFRAKMDSATLISVGTDSGTTFLVCNALRVDAQVREIDQEPFAVAVTPSGASTGGAFLHHGSWPDRTTSPPADFWRQVDESGIGNYLYSNPPSRRTFGSLDELPRGDREAFERSIALVGPSNTSE